MIKKKCMYLQTLAAFFFDIKRDICAFHKTLSTFLFLGLLIFLECLTSRHSILCHLLFKFLNFLKEFSCVLITSRSVVYHDVLCHGMPVNYRLQSTTYKRVQFKNRIKQVNKSVCCLRFNAFLFGLKFMFNNISWGVLKNFSFIQEINTIKGILSVYTIHGR